MTDEPLSDGDLAAQQADLLPPREAMTLIDTSALGAAYAPAADGNTAAAPTSDGAAAPGSATAGDTAGAATQLTEGTSNPSEGYSASQTASAES